MRGCCLVTLVLTLVVTSIFTVAAEVCVPAGDCKCKAGSFTVDLTGLLNGQNPRFNISNPTQPSTLFYYMPCQPLKNPAECPNIGTTHVCQQTGSGGSFDLGDTEDFSGDLMAGTLTVSYKATADNRVTNIHLQCSDETKLEFMSENPTLTYNFTLSTFIVCTGNRSSGLSIGSILVIIFFVTFSLYWILGILFMKFVRRSQGMEMIPNIEFWKELPLVIRDGFVFTARGCKGETTYEKI